MPPNQPPVAADGPATLLGSGARPVPKRETTILVPFQKPLVGAACPCQSPLVEGRFDPAVLLAARSCAEGEQPMLSHRPGGCFIDTSAARLGPGLRRAIPARSEMQATCFADEASGPSLAAVSRLGSSNRDEK
jgi:hypothetical protein